MSTICTKLLKIKKQLDNVYDEFSSYEEILSQLDKQLTQKEYKLLADKIDKYLASKEQIIKLSGYRTSKIKLYKKQQELYNYLGIDKTNSNILGNYLNLTFYRHTNNRKFSPILVKPLNTLDSKDKLLNLFQQGDLNEIKKALLQEVNTLYPENSISQKIVKEAIEHIYTSYAENTALQNILDRFDKITFDIPEDKLDNIENRALLPFIEKVDDNTYKFSKALHIITPHIINEVMAIALDPSTISNDKVARILGYKDETQALQSIDESTFYHYVNEFRNKGLPTAEIEQVISTQIFGLLNIEPNSILYSTGEVNVIKNLISNAVLKTMSLAGYLKQDKVKNPNSNKQAYNVYRVNATPKFIADKSTSYKKYSSFLQRVLALDKNRKQPTTDLKKNQVDITIKKHKSYNVGSRMINYLNLENNTKYVKNQAYKDFMKLYTNPETRELALKIAGTVNLNDLPEQDKSKMVGYNQAIEDELDNLLMFDSDLDQGVYIPHVVVANMRIQQEGPLNPQANKAQRHLINKEGLTVTINLNTSDKYNTPELVSFYISVLQALGKDVDKNTDQLMEQDIESLKQVLENKYKGNDNVFIKLQQILNDPENNLELIANLSNSEEALYTYHAIQELIKLKQADTKFITDLPQEMDGITNGMILTILQAIGHNDSLDIITNTDILSFIKELLSKGGIYVTPELFKNSQELLDKYNKGTLTHADLLKHMDNFTDFYATLAKSISDNIKAMLRSDLQKKENIDQDLLAYVGDVLSRNDAKPLQMVQIYGAKFFSILNKFYNTGLLNKYNKDILTLTKEVGNEYISFPSLDGHSSNTIYKIRSLWKTLNTLNKIHPNKLDLKFVLFDPIAKRNVEVIQSKTFKQDILKELETLGKHYKSIENPDPEITQFVNKLTTLYKLLNDKTIPDNIPFTSYLLHKNIPIKFFTFGKGTKTLLKEEFDFIYKEPLKEAFSKYEFIENYRDDIKSMHKLAYHYSKHILKNKLKEVINQKLNTDEYFLNKVKEHYLANLRYIDDPDKDIEIDTLSLTDKDFNHLMNMLSKSELDNLLLDLTNSGLFFDTISSIDRSTYIPLEKENKITDNTEYKSNKLLYTAKNGKLKQTNIGASTNLFEYVSNELAASVVTIHDRDSNMMVKTMFNKDLVNSALQIWDAKLVPSQLDKITQHMFLLNRETIKNTLQDNVLLNFRDKLVHLDQHISQSEKEDILIDFIIEATLSGKFGEVSKFLDNVFSNLKKILSTDFVDNFTQPYVKLFNDNNIISGQYYIATDPYLDPAKVGIYSEKLKFTKDDIFKPHQTNKSYNISLSIEESFKLENKVKEYLANKNLTSKELGNIYKTLSDLYYKNSFYGIPFKSIYDLVFFHIYGEYYKQHLDKKIATENKNIIKQVNAIIKASGVKPKLINFSGGADGADTLWDNTLKKFFNNSPIYQAMHLKPYYMDTHSGNIKVDKSALEVGKNINTLLGNNTHDMNNRNSYQIYNADVVIAVTRVNIDPTTGDYSLGRGGTTSALKYAELLEKPIYVIVFNDDEGNQGKLYKLDSKIKKAIEIEDVKDMELSNKVALIGTRDIDLKKHAKVTNKMYYVAKELYNRYNPDSDPTAEPTDPKTSNDSVVKDNSKNTIISSESKNNILNKISKIDDKYITQNPTNAIWGMRNGNPNFGNPFVTKPEYVKNPEDFYIGNNKQATIAFYKWLKYNEIPENYYGNIVILNQRRQEILNNLYLIEDVLNGNKKIYYKGTAKDLEYNHIKALLLFAHEQQPNNQEINKHTLEYQQEYYNRNKIEKENDNTKLYLFGDNVSQRNTNYHPNSTQAVIRGLSNAFGISTKKSYTPGSRPVKEDFFLTEEEFRNNLKKELQELKEHLIKHPEIKTIIYPMDGIGTGKANNYNPGNINYNQIIQEELKKILQDIDSTANTNKLSTKDKPIEIYTDGSDIKGTGKIGSGVYIKYNNKEYTKSTISDPEEFKKKYNITTNVSNPTMELQAVIDALEEFKNTGEHLKIYIDYQGIIGWLKLGWKPSKPYTKDMVNKAKQLINQIESNGGSVEIEKVKAHSGIDGNEKVDKIAKDRNIYNNIQDIFKDNLNNIKLEKQETVSKKENTITQPNQNNSYRQDTLFSSPFTSKTQTNTTYEFTSKEEVLDYLTNSLDGIIDPDTNNLLHNLLDNFYDISNVLNIVEGLSDKFNTGSAHITMKTISKSKIKIFKGANTSIQSEKEILIHELLHLLTHKAFKENHHLKTKILHLQQNVIKYMLKDKSIDPEMFFTDTSNPTILEREQSKALFEYIQGNPEEFFTIALTNKHLKNYILKNKNNIKINNKILKEIKENNFIHKLFNTIIKVINTIYNKMFTSNKQVDTELTDIMLSAITLTKQLYTGSVPKTLQQKVEDKVYKFTGLNELNAKWTTSMTKLNNSLKEFGNKLLEHPTIETLTKNLNKLFKKLNFDFINFIGDLWKELVIGNDRFNDFTLLYSKAKYDQEKVRNDLELMTKEYLNKVILKDLSKSDKIALTNTLLKTDVTSLGDIRLMRKYILNDEDRKEKIKELENLLKYHGNTGLAMLNQSKALGYFLATGKVTIDNMMLNAYNINNLHFDKTNTLLPVSVDLTTVIDQLTTLYALDYQDSDTLITTKKFILNNSKNFTDLINFIRNTIKKDTDKLFENQEIFKIKGHIRPDYNSFYEYIYVQEHDIPYYKKQLFTEPFKTEYIDPLSKKPVYIMKRLNSKPEYTKGMIEITNYDTAGMTLRSRLADGRVIERFLNQRIQELRITPPLTSNSFDPEKITKYKYVPVLNPEGGIVDYRVLGTDLKSETYKGYQPEIDNVLANTHAHNSLKVKGRPLNLKLFKALKEMYEKDPYKSQYIDLKTYEHWEIVPDYTKNDLYSIFGDDPIYIHKRLINDVLGYKDPTIINALLINKLPKRVQQGLQILEKLWRDLIKMIKPTIAITNLPVLYSNFLSNYFVLSQFMTFKDIYKAFRSNWIYYDKLHEELDNLRRLEIIRKFRSLNKQEQYKMKVLKDSIHKNPLYPLIKNGLIGSIIEDATDTSDNKTNFVKHKVNQYIDKIPSKYIKSLIDTIWLNENESLYKKTLKVLQYSDAIAKATLYQHLKSKGYSDKEALLEADATFINYNLNENKYIKYMSNIGLFMFSKFFLQTPKVIGNIIRKDIKGPLKLLSLNSIVDVPEIYETYNTSIDQALLARVIDPEDALLDLISPAPLRH